MSASDGLSGGQTVGDIILFCDEQASPGKEDKKRKKSGMGRVGCNVRSQLQGH